MTDAPRAVPKGTDKSGPGCMVIAIALPLVVLLGIVIGTVLNRSDEGPEERSATVATGQVGDTEWRVEAVRDVEGEVCAFLYEDGVQLTGACDDTPQDATFGDQTVIFGRAPAGRSAVTVVLTDATSITIDTEAVAGIDGRFYVEVVEGDLDAERLDRD